MDVMRDSVEGVGKNPLEDVSLQNHIFMKRFFFLNQRFQNVIICSAIEK